MLFTNQKWNVFVLETQIIEDWEELVGSLIQNEMQLVTILPF